MTHQVAHDDFAVAAALKTLHGSGLGAGIACRLGGLLDTANRGGRGSLRSWAACRVATAANVVAALSGGDLVERLVEFARHNEEVNAGWYGW